MADNKLTILYSRLSCEDENRTGESLSIENQRRILEDYAISMGFTNLLNLSDVCVIIFTTTEKPDMTEIFGVGSKKYYNRGRERIYSN